jgi:hypothetical protein
MIDKPLEAIQLLICLFADIKQNFNMYLEVILKEFMTDHILVLQFRLIKSEILPFIKA